MVDAMAAREGPDVDDPFVGVADATFDASGRVYVLDTGRRLVAFDEHLNPRWIAGGPGRGPAEFGFPGVMSWAAGLLAVWDHELGRLSYWTREGAHRGVRFVGNLPLHPYTVLHVDSAAIALVALPPVSLQTEPQRIEGVVLLTRDESATYDTLATIVDWTPAVLNSAIGPAIVPLPFRPFPSMAVRNGRMYYAEGSSYDVSIRDGTGRAVAAITVDTPGPRVRETDLRRVAENLPDPVLLERLDIPAEKPAIVDMHTTADGGLLVRTGWASGTAVRWDHWNAKLERVAAYLVPENIELLDGHGSTLLARTTDDLGVERVAILRPGTPAKCP